MRKKLTYENVYDELTRRIRDGEWPSGKRLPTIDELAKQLNVGVSSVREAVRILNKQNILRVEQGRGMFVRDDIPAEQSGDFLKALESSSWLQLTRARLVIEPELSAMAARDGTDAEIAGIVANAKAMEGKIRKGQPFLKEDLQFHRLIAVASHNGVLVAVLDYIGDLLTDSRRRTMAMPGMDEKAASFHTLIAKAIEARNAGQAKDLMRLHLEDMLDQFPAEK